MITIPDTVPPRPRAIRHVNPTRPLIRSWREALIPLGTGDTAAVPALRAMVRRIMAGWKIPQGIADNVELAASELATNALLHTCGPVRVRLAYRHSVVKLDVADTSTARPVAVRDGFDIERIHGRGLGIVATIADRIRTERYSTGTVLGKVTIAEFHVR